MLAVDAGLHSDTNVWPHIAPCIQNIKRKSKEK